MKRTAILTLFILSTLFGFAQPKNIILVMADGVGFNHAQIIQNNKSCPLHKFDVNYAVANYPSYWSTLDKEKDVEYFRGDYHVRRVWEEFDYADSLPIDPITAGSALATGVKTAYEAVSYDMDGTELETIIERAIAKGKATALLTDGDLFGNNAIFPFVCHSPVADDDDDYENLFFSMVNNSQVNLVAGSGVLGLENPNWSYVDKMENFPGDLSKQVLFSTENFTLNDELINSSLDLLNQNNNGFVAVAEFSEVVSQFDCKSFEPTATALDNISRRIETIYNWVEQNSSWDETLMIFVGSYEMGYLASQSFDKTKPITHYLSQSPTDMQYYGGYPTNLLTPMFAKGKGSELFHNYIDETDFLLGSYISNSEIAQVIFRCMPNEVKQPKNIIFMVNDGCGISPIKAADYYTGTTASYESFPVHLWNCTHASVSSSNITSLQSWNNTYESRLAWTGKDYLWARKNATCSGASGTAMATGKKTYYYSLGVDVEKNALKSIARYAKEMGKAAGVATNAPYYDATPGAFFTNGVSRENYNDLSRQVIIESNADVVIGCSHPEYDNNAQLKKNPDYSKIGGKEMIDGLRAGATEYQIASNSGWNTVRDIDGDGEPDPWTFVEDSANLVKYMEGETPKRLFAMIPVEGSMQFYRDGISVNEVHFDDWNPKMPRLWQIAKTAINCLDDNENGFFLMIEGDMVDNSGHKNYPGRQIEEQMEFNRTVDTVISWIERNSSWDETLLIVTADHETGFIADPYLKEDSIMLKHWQIIDNGVGNMPGLAFYAVDHSNQLVPLFAKGAGSEVLYNYADEWDYVRGKYLNNSEIGQTMFQLWGGQACSVVNERPQQNFADTIFVPQSKDFEFFIPKDFVTDSEDEPIVKLKSGPSWVKFDEERFVLYGTTMKRLGTSIITFTVTDGQTTGASISIDFYLNICVYKEEQPEALDEIASEQVSVYPNPVIEKITVKSDSDNGTILVRSIDGRIVKEIAIKGTLTEIPVCDLRAGEYLIQIIESNNVTTKKVIVR